MLKAVLMDIDDTLLDFGKCAEQAMRIGFAERGLPFDNSTYAVFTRINDVLWQQIERGELTTQQLFEFRWNRIFEALGIEADGVAFEKRFLDLLYETAIPVDARTRSAAISRESTFSARRATPSTTSSSTVSLCQAFSPTLTMYLFRSRSATASPRRRFSTPAALFFPMLPRTNAS